MFTSKVFARACSLAGKRWEIRLACHAMGTIPPPHPSILARMLSIDGTSILRQVFATDRHSRHSITVGAPIIDWSERLSERICLIGMGKM